MPTTGCTVAGYLDMVILTYIYFVFTIFMLVLIAVTSLKQFGRMHPLDISIIHKFVILII